MTLRRAFVLLIAVAMVSGGVGATLAAAPVDDSVATRLLLGVAGLPPMQALLEVTKQLLPQGPTYLPWTTVLPPLPVPYTPPPADACPSGSSACVTDLIAVMSHRTEEMARRCDDNAPFLQSYLRVTQVENAFIERGEFQDAKWLNSWDVHFADAYFTAIDGYYGGRPDNAPEAWRRAFRAADDHSSTVLGNAVLAYNAHITRDLPFVVADMGITAPDGTSRKPDYERGNKMLVESARQVVPDLASRYGAVEPLLPAGAAYEPMTSTAFGLVVQAWREYVWRAAEQLVLAPNPEVRAVVSQQIEQLSNVLGEVIERLFARTDPLPHQARCPR